MKTEKQILTGKVRNNSYNLYRDDRLVFSMKSTKPLTLKTLIEGYLLELDKTIEGLETKLASCKYELIETKNKLKEVRIKNKK